MEQPSVTLDNRRNDTSPPFAIVSNISLPIRVPSGQEFEGQLSFSPPSSGWFTTLLSICSVEGHGVQRIQQISLHGEGDLPSTPTQIIYADNQSPLIIETPKKLLHHAALVLDQSTTSMSNSAISQPLFIDEDCVGEPQSTTASQSNNNPQRHQQQQNDKTPSTPFPGANKSRRKVSWSPYVSERALDDAAVHSFSVGPSGEQEHHPDAVHKISYNDQSTTRGHPSNYYQQLPVRVDGKENISANITSSLSYNYNNSMATSSVDHKAVGNKISQLEQQIADLARRVVTPPHDIQNDKQQDDPSIVLSDEDLEFLKELETNTKVKVATPASWKMFLRPTPDDLDDSLANLAMRTLHAFRLKVDFAPSVLLFADNFPDLEDHQTDHL
eukprot:gene2434-2765_t